MVAGDLARCQCSAVVCAAYRMPDEHGVLLLAVPVDAAVALFHDVGIPRNLYVDEVVAVVLEVDPFRCSVGGKQDADGRHCRVGLKCCLDDLAFVGRNVTVEEGEPVAAVTVTRQNLLEPGVRRSVLREQDDALVVPLTIVVPEVRRDPVEDRRGLGVGLVA